MYFSTASRMIQEAETSWYYQDALRKGDRNNPEAPPFLIGFLVLDS